MQAPCALPPGSWRGPTFGELATLPEAGVSHPAVPRVSLSPELRLSSLPTGSDAHAYEGYSLVRFERERGIGTNIYPALALCLVLSWPLFNQLTAC